MQKIKNVQKEPVIEFNPGENSQMIHFQIQNRDKRHMQKHTHTYTQMFTKYNLYSFFLVCSAFLGCNKFKNVKTMNRQYIGRSTLSLVIVQNGLVPILSSKTIRSYLLLFIHLLSNRDDVNSNEIEIVCSCFM